MTALVHDEDLDPAGDLVLIVGELNSQTRIRVSSKVMALASPVLAAMLGPNYREGQALSKQGLLELELPDDDPEAMVCLCKAFHMKLILGPISILLLEKIALLCDKYDEALALSSWSDTWLAEFAGSVDGENSLPKLLWISYALGNHFHFWVSSFGMMWNYTEEGLLATEAELVGTCLPKGILGKSLRQEHPEDGAHSS